ncbi:MAG: hypothetical protein JW982_07545 [Spirochaetes bacterium]|nr:hypothetical protein [Spirochaetota bacterium]
MNASGKIFINELKNEFFIIDEEITVPQFSVKEISFSQKLDFDKKFKKVIPFYIENHDLLLEPVPKSDTHFIHYVQNIHGKYFDFLHVFKIDLKFSGDSSMIIEKGNPDFYPSYRTDRLYYKSYVIPVKKIEIENKKIARFESESLVSKIKVESDQYFHTFAMFDEFDKTSLIDKLNEIIDIKSLPVLYKIYSFWDFHNFTFALNILNPINENIINGIELFEPAWIVVKSEFDSEFLKYITAENCEECRDFFRQYINHDSEKLYFTDGFHDSLKKYLSCYSFHTDDDLAVKRWKRIDIKN